MRIRRSLLSLSLLLVALSATVASSPRSVDAESASPLLNRPAAGALTVVTYVALPLYKLLEESCPIVIPGCVGSKRTDLGLSVIVDPGSTMHTTPFIISPSPSGSDLYLGATYRHSVTTNLLGRIRTKRYKARQIYCTDNGTMVPSPVPLSPGNDLRVKIMSSFVDLCTIDPGIRWSAKMNWTATVGPVKCTVTYETCP